MIFAFTLNDTVALWRCFQVSLITELIDKKEYFIYFILFFNLIFDKNVIHYTCNKIQLQFMLNDSMGKGVLTILWLSHLTTSQNTNKTGNND